MPRIFRSRITRPTRPPMWWPASASRDRREFLSLRSGVHCFWRYVSASRHRVGQRISRSTGDDGRGRYLPPTADAKIWGGERHVHISRNREHTREYHEIAITSSTRRWNVMASIGSRIRIPFYRISRSLTDFLLYQTRARRAIRPVFCLHVVSRSTRYYPCTHAIDGDRTHAVVNNDPTAAPPLGDSP